MFLIVIFLEDFKISLLSAFNQIAWAYWFNSFLQVQLKSAAYFGFMGPGKFKCDAHRCIYFINLLLKSSFSPFLKVSEILSICKGIDCYTRS